jgi:hypothetical protein
MNRSLLQRGYQCFAIVAIRVDPREAFASDTLGGSTSDGALLCCYLLTRLWHDCTRIVAAALMNAHAMPLC